MEKLNSNISQISIECVQNDIKKEKEIINDN